jgi:hypothetical protein
MTTNFLSASKNYVENGSAIAVLAREGMGIQI